DRAGDHAHTGQSVSGDLIGDVREGTSVIPEQKRGSRERIVARMGSSRDKQIKVAVAVPIRSGYAGAAGIHVGDRLRVEYQVSAAVIEIEVILVIVDARHEFISTADNIQVQVTVTVCVEEKRSQVVTSVFGRERLLRECSVALLKIETSGELLRSSD